MLRRCDGEGTEDVRAGKGGLKGSVAYVGINLSRHDAAVAEEALDEPDIGARFQ